MIETLKQFNEAYRKLQESPRGEWFRHTEFPLARGDEWSRTVLETDFARHAERIFRFSTVEEETHERKLGKSRNEKDLLCALLMDLGLLSPDFPTESSIEQ